jgi:hypothetical protein
MAFLQIRNIRLSLVHISSPAEPVAEKALSSANCGSQVAK